MPDQCVEELLADAEELSTKDDRDSFERLNQVHIQLREMGYEGPLPRGLAISTSS